MQLMTIQEMIDRMNAKTIEDVIPSLALNFLVPEAQYGFGPGSFGNLDTEADYELLVWFDERTKPTWSELLAVRADVLVLEKAIDADEIRRARYQDTTLTYAGFQFHCNPQALSLLSELIDFAPGDEFVIATIPVLDRNKIARLFTRHEAVSLRSEMRAKVQQWLKDPTIE